MAENKMKEIFLPLIDGENAPTEQFVGFNGKAYRIKRGETVKVPEGVYNILMESQEAKNRAIREKQKRGIKRAKDGD
ncbi:MAG: hypothetical protein IJ002_03150 [Clostridia bacterium]|nr:hypothetical protein [Clostridia bacterium]MBQ8836489.1 hypothetical protein [Clostridia bacterium]